MLVALIAAIFVTLATIAYLAIQHKYRYWSSRRVPHLPPTFPFGNLENPRTKKSAVGAHIAHLYTTTKSRQWPHAGLYFFLKPTFLLADLERIKNVMTRDFDHFADRGMYYNEKNDPISGHLFAVGGDKWKALRSNLTPTFTAAKMRPMFATFMECVAHLVRQMERRRSARCIDIKELLGRFSTDIIGSCAFGLDTSTMQDDNNPFRVYGKKVFASSKWRNLKLSFASSFPHLGRWLRITQVTGDVSGFFTQIVHDTVKYRKDNNVQRPDFLQMLIELANDGQITMDQIVAQAFIFFLAGFETSSTAMTFTLYELAENQEVQERARDEIGQVLAKYNGEMSYEALNEMKYLNQVVNEALRKYPPLPFVTRTCVKEYEMEGVTIEKGIRLVIPILGIHYDPDYFPEPDRFDPERFGDEESKGRHPYAYMPFGEGPRNCIGMRFGLMQTKVGLVGLLRRFRFTVNERTKRPLKMAPRAFILAADGGIWLDSHKL